MEIINVRLDEVEVEDQRFRISEDLGLQSVRDSLAAIGQLNPVNLLVEQDAGMIVICGFRRLRALHQLMVTDILARLWPADRCSPIQALSMALWDNLSHRRLNPLEIARVLTKFKNICLLPDKVLVESYLPILGFSPHPRVLKDFLTLDKLQPGLRSLLLEGRITAGNAVLFAGSASKMQVKMADLLRTVHLSSSLQREVFILINDLAAMEDLNPEEVLDRPEIRDVSSDMNLSAAKRGEVIHRFLRRERNPRFMKARETFESGKKKLRLPESVRISPDPFFETSRLRFQFDVRSLDDYREVVEALYGASKSGSVESLFRIDG